MNLSLEHTPKTKEKLPGANTIVVSVPYRMPGNVIKHKKVSFEIEVSFNRVSAKPLCDEGTKRMLNLPPELVFYMVGDVVIGQRPALKDVYRNIADALSIAQPLLLS